MKAKHLWVPTLALLLCFSLVGCGSAIKGDEAKAHVEDFLAQVEKGDYAAAAEYLHPDRPADPEAFFTGLEADWDVDFQSGIEIVRYTGFSSATYDSTVGGAAYTLKFDAKVSGKPLAMEIELVRNDEGFGIYNLDITK